MEGEMLTNRIDVEEPCGSPEYLVEHVIVKPFPSCGGQHG